VSSMMITQYSPGVNILPHLPFVLLIFIVVKPFENKLRS